jgi:cytochrome c oxidase subunit IV
MNTPDSHEHNDQHEHVSSYALSAKVLLALLVLTFLSVWITKFHFGAFSVAVALLLATIKAATVITWFMHLKYESLFIKLMVVGVFALFVVVIIITFIDYYFR